VIITFIWFWVLLLMFIYKNEFINEFLIIFNFFFKRHLIDDVKIAIFDPNRNVNERYQFWVH
jgi:hypothetical protein